MRLTSSSHFFRVRLDGASQHVDRAAFERAVDAGLGELFGELGGGALAPELLSFDEAAREGVLRVPAAHRVAVRAALTLLCAVDGTEARFETTAEASFLHSLG